MARVPSVVPKRWLGQVAAAVKPRPEPASQGLSYEEIQKIHAENVFPTQTPMYKKPLLLKKGSMQHVWDDQGKQYLDLWGGIVTVSVGHCHPRVLDAAINQMQKLWHTTSVYLSEPIHEYAQKLTATLPDKLKVCYFVNSGSEANDLAITLARLHTGNLDLIAFRNAYHGGSSLVLGTIGMGTWRQPIIAHNFHHTVNPNPYRGVWGGKNCRDSPVQALRDCACNAGHCNAADRYVEQAEDLLVHCTPPTGVAGFIAESIQGGGGIVQFPKGTLKRIVDKVRKRGGIYIADEVQTGFGRTGEHFWGFQGHGVTPDIGEWKLDVQRRS